jgi:hypothetical protein
MNNLKQKFEELRDKIGFNNGISDDFYGDYKGYLDSSDYICDAFTDYANQRVDIYTHDLFEWAESNYDVIEEANNEFGHVNDIIGQIRQAQFYKNHNKLYEDINDIIKKLAFNYIVENIENQQYTDEQIDDFIIDIESIDNNSRLNDIKDLCDEFLNKTQE